MMQGINVSDRFADKRWPALDLGVGYLLVDFDGNEIDQEAELPSIPAIAIDDPRVAFTLAMLLQRKYFLEDAKRWYRNVIATGSVPAMNNLAVHLAEGDDYGQARTLFEDAADRGSMTAAYNAGLLATERDDSAAGLRWLGRAADSGHVPSMILMAMEAHDEGSHDEARSWLYRAAKVGDAKAANLLGLQLYEEDKLAIAEEWLVAAADRGHLAAMNNLAVMVEDRDPEMAERRYKEAAAEGSATAFLIQVVRNTRRSEHQRVRTERGRWSSDEAEDDETLEDTDLDADAGGLTAMLNLAGFRWKQGDRRAAEQLYGELAGAGVVEGVLGQAELFAEQGRDVEASLCYQRAAKSGLNDARVALAEIYSQGNSGRYAEAEELLRAAAEEDHPAALRQLALRSQQRGDDADAIALLERAAGLGDVKSMTSLGELHYQNGDEVTAAEWLSKAAEADYPRAMAILGSVTLPTAADASDASSDAVDWLFRAAQTGEPLGMNNLGVLLCNQGDLDRGELWLRRAYAIGASESVYTLINWSLKTGHLAQAGVWCARAAEAGIPEASTYLDDLAYMRDVRRSSDTWELTNYLVAALERRGQADAWYEYFAQAGCPRAMARFGAQLLSRGERSQAWFWIERAAEHGIADAMNTLASLIEGAGSAAESAEWRRKAADAELPEAVKAMGDLRHGENDLDGAELWYRRGADLGNTPAMGALGQMLLQSGEESEGVYWLRRTADEGDARACLLVGRWLLDNGLPGDAEGYVQTAFEAGEAGASLALAELLRRQARSKDVNADQAVDLLVRAERLESQAA